MFNNVFKNKTYNEKFMKNKLDILWQPLKDILKRGIRNDTQYFWKLNVFLFKNIWLIETYNGGSYPP